MKDAKVTTTTIPANRKRESIHDMLRKSLDGAIAEARRAGRLAVLEEVESEIKNISDALEEESYTGTLYKTVYKQALEAINTIINRMKEATK